MIVARPDVGERPEGEGALHLANVILEDPLRTGREQAFVVVISRIFLKLVNSIFGGEIPN